MIHPTAIIHPSAQLGEGVHIGPYCVLDGPVVLGAHTVLEPHVVIKGRVTVGAHCTVGSGTVLGGLPQDLAFQGDTQSGVTIGGHCRLGEHCTVHRGTAEGTVTTVGDSCFLMAGTHLAHNVQLASRVIIANNTLLGGYTQVEEGVFIGGGCVFHQHVRVGRLAIAQGASAFSKDIPPYTLAAERNLVAGLNVVGLRRAGLNPSQRLEIKRAFHLLYRQGLNVSQALAAAREHTWGAEAQAFFDFAAAAKKRGLCALLRSARQATGAEADEPAA